jgi:hypothetical protein
MSYQLPAVIARPALFVSALVVAGCFLVLTWILTLRALLAACCLLLLLLAPGWFSLNVPSGLTLYWFVNNIISTAMQIYMKKTIKVDMPPLAAAGEANAIIDVTGEVIKPKEDREKKVGANLYYLFTCNQSMRKFCPSLTSRARYSSPNLSIIDVTGEVIKPKKDREQQASAGICVLCDWCDAHVAPCTAVVLK